MRRTRRLLAVGLLALTLLTAAPTAAVAAVDVVPVDFEMPDLRPGERRSHDVPLHVRAAATVTAVELVADGAPAVAWDARLCDAGGACRTVDPTLVGQDVDPGTWTVTVSATAATTLQPGDRSTVTGRIVLTGGDVVVGGGGAVEGGVGGSVASPPAVAPPDGTVDGAAATGAAPAGPLAMTGADVPLALAVALAVTAGGAWLVVLARRRRDDRDDDTTDLPEGARP